MSVGVAGKFKQKIERVRSQSEIRKYRAPSYPFETSNYRQSHILTAGIDTGGYFEIILALSVETKFQQQDDAGRLF